MRSPMTIWGSCWVSVAHLIGLEVDVPLAVGDGAAAGEAADEQESSRRARAAWLAGSWR